MTRLATALARNPALTEVIDHLATLGLPGAYVTAGCVFQTVWNVVTGRPAGAGIRDYDVFYYDSSDLSQATQDATGARFAGLRVATDVVNEARVHLWYEDVFGVPCAPFTSSEEAIDHFAAKACAVGVRRAPEGGLQVYAPFGLEDVFGLVVRPNPVLAPRHVYEAKAARWQAQWPELTVLPWQGR